MVASEYPVQLLVHIMHVYKLMRVCLLFIFYVCAHTHHHPQLSVQMEATTSSPSPSRESVIVTQSASSFR